MHEDGTVFDSSYEKGIPFKFSIGEGLVLKEWEKLVEDMKLDEMKQIIIQSNDDISID